MRKGTLSRLSALVLGASAILPNIGTSSEVINKAPVYSLSVVPPFYCSRYVRLAAHDLFGKDYIGANAWDLDKHCKIVAKVGTNSIESFVESGELKEGMVVGLYNTKSKYNAEGRLFTHVALCIGHKGNEPLFAHLYGVKTYTETAKQIMDRGLEFREILDSKN